MNPMTTYMANEATIDRKWCVVDLKGKILGRAASVIASRLRGKHKAEYTPHADVGDYIIVLNAAEVAVTGTKDEKPYYRHTGYFGGIKSESFSDLKARAPERIIELAVKGMLPRGPLGRKMLEKLKVYPGSEHPHAAQQPIPLDI
jgi:large subunit ribosomal protein L13